jgi:Putative Actinobacterial Holin-X, holin superfamily III
MPTLTSGLLRTGLALKLSQIKLATRSYLRDRTNQATSTVTAYAIAAGLFAAASVFLIAASLVGAAAVFRWIEVNYGLFQAFGAIGALLLVAAAICAALAVSSVKRAPPQFPSLTSRLRVAIAANPLHSDQNPTAQDISSAVLFAPADTVRRIRNGPRPEREGLPISGLILVATLLGWAVARRRQQARRTRPKVGAIL